MKMVYIRGEDNTVADALSRVAPNAFPDERELPLHEGLAKAVGVILTVGTDEIVLSEIRKGYETNSVRRSH